MTTTGTLQRINPTTLPPLLRRTAPLSLSKSPLSFLSSASPRRRFSLFLSRTVAYSLRNTRCLCSKMAASQIVVREPDLLERKKVSIRNSGTGKLQVRNVLIRPITLLIYISFCISVLGQRPNECRNTK